MSSRDVVSWNALISGHMKCGSMAEAWTVFNKNPCCDMVSWNIMISEHVKCGKGTEALALFWQMKLEGMKPSSATFAGVVNSCAIIVALEEGRSTCKTASLTCMQNAGAWKMLGECSTRWPHMMWFLGISWYWGIWNMGNTRKHWNYFPRCKRKAWSQPQTLS